MGDCAGYVDRPRRRAVRCHRFGAASRTGRHRDDGRTVHQHPARPGQAAPRRHGGCSARARAGRAGGIAGSPLPRVGRDSECSRAGGRIRHADGVRVVPRRPRRALHRDRHRRNARHRSGCARCGPLSAESRGIRRRSSAPEIRVPPGRLRHGHHRRHRRTRAACTRRVRSSGPAAGRAVAADRPGARRPGAGPRPSGRVDPHAAADPRRGGRGRSGRDRTVLRGRRRELRRSRRAVESPGARTHRPWGGPGDIRGHRDTAVPRLHSVGVGGGEDRCGVRADRSELPRRAHHPHARRFRSHPRRDHDPNTEAGSRAPRTGWPWTNPASRPSAPSARGHP